jgi:hypothetical protein
MPASALIPDVLFSKDPSWAYSKKLNALGVITCKTITSETFTYETYPSDDDSYNSFNDYSLTHKHFSISSNKNGTSFTCKDLTLAFKKVAPGRYIYSCSLLSHTYCNFMLFLSALREVNSLKVTIANDRFPLTNTIVYGPFIFRMAENLLDLRIQECNEKEEQNYLQITPIGFNVSRKILTEEGKWQRVCSYRHTIGNNDATIFSEHYE